MSCEGSDYSPNSLVRAFHDIPHVDIDLDSSPDQFETSLEYLEAIIIWACVPILVCVCLFILLSVYFICICCGFCCGERASRKRTRRNVCGILITLLITLCLAMVGVGIWAEVALNNDINDFVDIAEDIDTTLQQFGGDSSTGYSETRVGDAIESLQAVVMMDENVTDALDRLDMENMAIGAAFVEIEPFIPVNSTLSDTLSDLEDFETSRHWVIIAYLIFLALSLLVLTLAICCAACFWSPTLIVIMLVVLFFVTFSVWIATGGSLAFMIVASDICDDPDELVRNYTQDFDADPRFVNYYIVCNSTCVPHPFLPEITQVQEALSDIMAQGDLEIVQDYINDGNTDLQPTFDIVVDGFDGAEDAVELLLDCATGLNRDYLDILEQICGLEFGILHAFLMFVMACGLAVSFVLLLMCGACYAGMLVSRKEFDEEGLQYDFPPATGPSAWESYGTQQHYTEGNYLQYRESYNLTSSPTGQDPPKYNELHQLNNGQQAQRHSGGYDHMES